MNNTPTPITKDFYMGLIMSTESRGLEINRLDQAVLDWENFYKGEVNTDFNNILCFLISQADLDNLHRISKGYPEHIRVFCEKHILAQGDINEEK